MTPAVVKFLFSKQTGEDLPAVLNDIHETLPAIRSDQEWNDAIYDRIKELDLNDAIVLKSLAHTLQQNEKQRRNATAPGKGAQLQLDLCTREWAEESIIILREGVSVRIADANHDHFMIGLSQRLQKVEESSQAAMRWTELARISDEAGGLRGALRRRGIPGW